MLGGQYLVICLLLYFSGVWCADLCVDFDEDTNLEDFVQNRATPAAGVNAGKFRKAENARDLSTCLLSCCARADCNVALLHNNTCLLIKCNSTESCKPETRASSKYDNTYMISVRSVDSAQETDADSLFSNLAKKSDCQPDTNEGCREHEVCDLQIIDDYISFGCVCEDNYLYYPRKDTCIDISAVRVCEVGLLDTCALHEECVPYQDNGRSRHGVCLCSQGYVSVASSNGNTRCVPAGDNGCEVGVQGECGVNEECQAKNNRARGGHCVCANGYVRSGVTSQCVQDIELKSTASVPTEKDTSSKSMPTTTTTTTTTSPTTTEEIKTTETTVAVSTTKTPLKVNTNGVGTKTPGVDRSTTVTPSLETIVVSAGGNKEIQLPDDKVTLQAYTAEDTEGHYTYRWLLLSHPDADAFGHMEDSNSHALKLSKLIAGDYQFKVVVTAEGKYGEATVNVTVLPAARQNEAPKAVIKPTTQQVNSPNDVVIDGSESTDDDKIVAYHWEQVAGPLGSDTPDQNLMSKAMLVLKGLAPGSYKFKLTVTDSDGVENFGFANVTVIKEVDYPPKANAGSNVIISLPQNSVKLYGNASTDDKGIVSYEWLKGTDDTLTADMTGVRTPVLQLDNLEEGDYTFTLKVTDSAAQTDTADVHVFVKAEHNKPPVARAGKDRTVLLPVGTVVLDGTNSSDEQGIQSYTWVQVAGPVSAAIENADRAVATVAKLQKGVYKFKLTVTDTEGLQGEATLTITAKENENHQPKANAGGDQKLPLPLRYATLDGSRSSDDKRIASWLWTRNPKSLAAGVVLNNSDHTPVLQLSELVAGRYMFTLEVTDEEGLSSTDTASLIVEHSAYEDDLVEVKLEADIHSFTEANKENLRNEISLLLHKQTKDGETRVNIESLRSDTVSDSPGNTGEDTVWSGPDVVSQLKSKLKSHDVFDFTVLSIDTVVCQNNCSNHGYCEQATKQCVCETFWVQNFFKAHTGDMESNCDWSILYVIIISFVIVITLVGSISALVCLINRWYRTRPKKRHRYELLKEVDDGESLSMLPKVETKDGYFELNGKFSKGKIQNTSIMVSESDFTSDEETLFISSKKAGNGHLRNGLQKPKTKVRT